MNQKSRQASRSRASGLLGGPWLARVLALLFALTLITIAVLMLCGSLIWQNPLIPVIGGILIPVFGDHFKLVFSEALHPSTADEGGLPTVGEGKREE